LDYKLILSDGIGAILVVGGLFCVILAKRIQEKRNEVAENEPLLPEHTVNGEKERDSFKES